MLRALPFIKHLIKVIAVAFGLPPFFVQRFDSYQQTKASRLLSGRFFKKMLPKAEDYAMLRMVKEAATPTLVTPTTRPPRSSLQPPSPRLCIAIHRQQKAGAGAATLFRIDFINQKRTDEFRGVYHPLHWEPFPPSVR
ncbi:MAG: hypothetical protein LBM74_06055 [Oscillospiraceae bacterium]|jgi:hypothetical protein|nr:hypothetical protein [Oscillospiraceae bacterium]